MRDSLTVLAILLIVLLTGALVGPYFIDWNSQRALIEAKLSQAAGVRVAIAGRIDVKLLPEPKFRLGRVTIGSTAPGQQGLTAAEVDVEIALTALMRGEVQVVDATLRGPRLDVSQAPDGSLLFPMRAVVDPGRIQFQHVAIADGVLNVTDARRGTWTLSGIDLDAEATSLLGPFKASGRFGSPDDAHRFHLSTGAFDGNKLRVKLALDGSGTRPSLDLDGIVLPGRATWAGAVPAFAPKAPSSVASLAKPPSTEAPGPSFAGTMTLAGSVPLAGRQGTVPWSLTGHVAADRDKAAFTEVELRAGTEMQALVATGDATATFGTSPAAKMRLHGTQVSLDRLAVTPDGTPKGPAKDLDPSARWSSLAAQARALDQLPFRLDLDYGFDTASIGDLTIFGIAGHVILDGQKPAQVRFAASGPESAHVALDGTFEPGAAPVFRGHLEASLRDLPRFADRFAASLPKLAAGIKSTVAARDITFGGTVDLSGVGIAARDVTLSLDSTKLGGTISYTGAVGDDRARLFADLSSDALDLDALPDLGRWTTGWGDLDLQLALAARAVKLAPAGLGAVDAGHIALRIDRTAGALRLDEFSAELGSARLSATASLDSKAAHAEAHVEAPQLDTIADLFVRLLPGRATTLFRERAGALSPAKLDIALDASNSSAGALLPTAISVQGTANGTRISAQLKPDRPGDLDPATATISARIAADAPEASVLLQQLGVPVAAVSSGQTSFGPAIGTGRIEIAAQGSVANGFDTTLAAMLGDATMSFNGKARAGLGSGRLSLKGTDFGRLLRGVGLVPIGGTEVWPADAGAELSWHDSSLGLRQLVGHFDGVAVRGDLNTDLAPQAVAQGARPTLFGTLQIDNVPASALFGLGLGASAPPVGAALWSDKPFGPVLLHLPRAEVAMRIGALGLRDGLEARNASLSLRTEGSAVTLANFTGTLAAVTPEPSGADRGSVGGTFTLRRDGPVASVTGIASWSNVAVNVSGLAGRIGGTLDLAGSGTTAAGLVGSLAGSGGLTLSGAQIARLDPGAIARTAAAVEKNTAEIDAEQVRGMLTSELDRGSLALGDIGGQATLAAGVLRTSDLHVDGGKWTADTNASFDLRTSEFASKTTLRARQPLPDWKGENPQLTVSLKGTPGALVRDADAAVFINALQSRAIARDQERIDIMQQDVRERAYFNRRLKVIEADQQAARDKAKADADAMRAKADADARAQAEAARAKAQAESEALQAKAKADAAAARDKGKAAADAHAAAEIERQISQDALKPFDLSTPKGRSSPGGIAPPSPGLRPGLATGIRPPTIGSATPGPKSKRSGARSMGVPSIIQERSPAPADPSSEGRY